MNHPDRHRRLSCARGYERAIRAFAAAAVIAVTSNSPAGAQPRDARTAHFGVDVAAASVGSATGLLVGYAIARPDECSSDDIECIIDSLGVAALLSTIAAPAAVLLADRWRGTDGSVIGVGVGSLAGVAASLGTIVLLEETMGRELSRPVALLTFSLPHGFITALGARAGRAWGVP